MSYLQAAATFSKLSRDLLFLLLQTLLGFTKNIVTYFIVCTWAFSLV